MRKDTRYIYKVDYGKKSPSEDWDVIKKVYYSRWDDEENKFVDRSLSNESFSKALDNEQFKAKAGNRCNGEWTNLVEVIAYKQDDGEIWIKTKADDTELNNLSLLEYAKKYCIANKI